MTLSKREYTFDDMVEVDLESAPSLDLPSLKIDHFYVPRDEGKYMLFLTHVVNVKIPEVCPSCKMSGTMIASGHAGNRLVHDVVRINHRVDIIFRPQRVQCKECGLRYVLVPEGIAENRSMTERLLKYLQNECFLQSQTDLAEKSGVSIETISNIMDLQIQEYEKERELNPLCAPRVLGIDEKHITNQMRGTLVDVEKGVLLDMMEGNKEKDMKDAIQKLVGWDTNIEVITTDMNNSYLSWLPDFLPNAKIVIDKFHVIQDIQRRISAVKSNLYEYRKNLIKKIEDLDEKERQLEVLDILNKNKRLMNYSMESISRDEKSRAQKLSVVMDEFPEFKLLRKLYYLIEEMYEKDTREEAEAVWDEWVKLLPPSGERQYREWCDLYSVVPPLFDEFRSFNRYGFQFFKPYILNFFEPNCRYTNAVTEGLNNLIGSINNVGNGYSFKVLRAKCLYASLVHERTIYSFNISSVKTWVPNMGMAFGSGRMSGTYETISKYNFIQDNVKVNIPPTNLFSDNKQLLETFVGSDQSDCVNVSEDSMLWYSPPYIYDNDEDGF